MSETEVIHYLVRYQQNKNEKYTKTMDKVELYYVFREVMRKLPGNQDVKKKNLWKQMKEKELGEW